MRADRLVATLLVLQNRGRVTASQLAAELEVSVSTARRDLEALSTAGIPVYSQPGRGGGWSLVGGARTDLTGLTAPEAQALFLLVGPAAGSSDQARSALRKLLQALPETFRTQATNAARATRVEPAGWGDADPSQPPIVDLLQASVVRQRQVDLDYVNRSGIRSNRRVSPWGVVHKGKVWYLVAGTNNGPRTFRVDRIRTADMTDQSATPPDDGALDAAWDRVVDMVEHQRSRTSATVTVERRFLSVLQAQFGAHAHEIEDAGEGTLVHVRVAAPTTLDIARHLAGWGSTISVIDPPGVREHLARLGRELVDDYG